MSTYLELTNEVLELINEVPLDENSFASARGIHASVKTNVRNTVQRINKHFLQWPFNAAEHTMFLAPGQEEYGWPQNYSTIDWNSFFLVKDESLGTETTKLLRLSRDDWYNKLKNLDDDKKPDGQGKPKFVFDAHGRGFGISPSPDELYEVKFRYFINPPKLNLHDDQCTIPVEWEFVIVDGVLYHMNLFKENSEVAANFRQLYRDGLSQMRTELINNYDYAQDTRINTPLPGSNGR